MKHLQKGPRKPLFTRGSSASITFMSLISDLDTDKKKIAEYVFLDGLTAEEIEEKSFYCKRQIERIRVDLMRLALRRAVFRIDCLFING